VQDIRIAKSDNLAAHNEPRPHHVCLVQGKGRVNNRLRGGMAPWHVLFVFELHGMAKHATPVVTVLSWETQQHRLVSLPRHRLVSWCQEYDILMMSIQ
jgi:hypothetical protein